MACRRQYQWRLIGESEENNNVKENEIMAKISAKESVIIENKWRNGEAMAKKKMWRKQMRASRVRGSVTRNARHGISITRRAIRRGITRLPPRCASCAARHRARGGGAWRKRFWQASWRSSISPAK